MQGATTSSIVSKYGEEERRRTRAKDTSMAREDSSDRPPMARPAIADAKREAIYPLAFSAGRRSTPQTSIWPIPRSGSLWSSSKRRACAAVKDEDQRQQWYGDWIAYQAAHGLYASVLSPKSYSTLGFEFDLLKLTRFLEVFGYFSPAHGYSLQVTFLGLFSILMGTNSALKQEAVAGLESGGLLAFGVSGTEPRLPTCLPTNSPSERTGRATCSPTAKNIISATRTRPP